MVVIVTYLLNIWKVILVTGDPILKFVRVI